jgi:hypothetical protein
MKNSGAKRLIILCRRIYFAPWRYFEPSWQQFDTQGTLGDLKSHEIASFDYYKIMWNVIITINNVRNIHNICIHQWRHTVTQGWGSGGDRRIKWVASTLHTTSEHGVSSITTADAQTSAANSRLNWRPYRFKCTRPFRRKTKSGFCACAITFETQSTVEFTLETTHNTLWEQESWQNDGYNTVIVIVGTDSPILVYHVSANYMIIVRPLVHIKPRLQLQNSFWIRIRCQCVLQRLRTQFENGWKMI